MFLNTIMNLTTCVITDGPRFANDLLDVTKKLVSTLVNETDIYISFSVQNLGKKSAFRQYQT